jgi:hypothetical protein
VSDGDSGFLGVTLPGGLRRGCFRARWPLAARPGSRTLAFWHRVPAEYADSGQVQTKDTFQLADGLRSRRAQSGLVLGKLFCSWFPDLAERPAAFAVVGMAAFFTAVVRAPVTGIILATEMTGCFTLLLPMLLACFAAMTVPTLLDDPPIYDTLRRPGAQQGKAQHCHSKKK